MLVSGRGGDAMPGSRAFALVGLLILLVPGARGAAAGPVRAPAGIVSGATRSAPGAAPPAAPEAAFSTAAPSLPDTLHDPDRIPLASDAGYRLPRDYPALEIGFGLRTWNPDVSGLAPVYGKTPTFPLSPLVCSVVTLSLSDVWAVQADAGTTFTRDRNYAYQGLLGLVVRPSLGSAATLRPFLGAGVTACSFHGEESETASEGGKTGFYAHAGTSFRLSPGSSLEIYAGYCWYSPVTTEFSIGGAPEERVQLKVELSTLILGARVQWNE